MHENLILNPFLQKYTTEKSSAYDTVLFVLVSLHRRWYTIISIEFHECKPQKHN